MGASAERFERRERRYLTRDVRTLLRHLNKRAAPAVYAVNTLYLDHPTATWSRKRGGGRHEKLRLRQYGTSAPWFFEVKQTRGGYVIKRREPVERLPLELRLLASVHYRRTAWQLEDGLRVTVDERIVSARGVLPGRVVEVKGTLPAWLSKRLPPETRGFSKSAWALGRWSP